MKFSSSISYLYNLRTSKGIDLTLERIKDALSAVGNPQEKFKTIHLWEQKENHTYINFC